jgi:hypothetical protein
MTDPDDACIGAMNDPPVPRLHFWECRKCGRTWQTIIDPHNTSGRPHAATTTICLTCVGKMGPPRGKGKR